jgi:hypothetical protein
VLKSVGSGSSDMPEGVVALVDAPVAKAYARKSQVAFFVTAALVGVPAAAVLSRVMSPVAGVVLGLFAGALFGVMVALLVAAWPVLRVVWHWAAEITLALLLVVGTRALASVVAPWLALVLVLVVFGAPMLFGPVRRRLVAFVWCVVVRHRLRLCFAEFIRATGRIHRHSPPIILLARPTPAGERVWVWLRPGLELTDLEGKAGKLAVACWASDVRVVRASERFAALLRVDVTRRDPLRTVVRSPLTRLVPDAVVVSAPVSPGLPPLGLDLPDVPEVLPDPPRAAARR